LIGGGTQGGKHPFGGHRREAQKPFAVGLCCAVCWDGYLGKLSAARKITEALFQQRRLKTIVIRWVKLVAR